VASNLRRSLHVSELLAAGLSEGEVAGRLGMPPWLVARANRGDPVALERALVALAELDVALKSSRPEAAEFEATVLAIVGRGAPARSVRLSR
jgi:hypothetical protein